MKRGSSNHYLSKSKGSEIILSIKNRSVTLFEKPGNNLWTFDLEGRPLGIFYQGKSIRRTLNNRYVLKSRKLTQGEIHRIISSFNKDEGEKLLTIGHQLIRKIISEIPSFNDLGILRKLLTKTPMALEQDAGVFRHLYLPVSILPPDQYLSLVVQLTEGCNFNQCLFCNFYKDRPFRIKSLDEVKQHVTEIKEYFGQGLSLRQSIFLADANALLTPMNRLVPLMGFVQTAFPKLKRIYSFCDVFTGVKKSKENLIQLKNLGLTRVYLGIESGHIPLLQFLRKPQNHQQILTFASRLKDAGINIGAIILAGAGGSHFHQKHIEDSTALLRAMELNQGDMVYISELDEPNPEYRLEMKKNGFSIPDFLTQRKMSKDIKYRLKSELNKNVKISPYDIHQFFY